jgi:hypothetical protein
MEVRDKEYIIRQNWPRGLTTFGLMYGLEPQHGNLYKAAPGET